LVRGQLAYGDCSAPLSRLRVQAASRSRQLKHASSAVDLANRMAAGQALDRQGYTALIAGNFWLTRDHKQMLDTVKAMVAAGHAPDESVLLQMLHVYCTSGMWGEALSVLDDVAAGRLGSISSSSSSRRPRQQEGYSSRDAEVREELLELQAAAAAAAAAAQASSGPSRTGSGWRVRRYEEDMSLGDDDAVESSSSMEQRQQQWEQLAHDKLWHVVLRQLWQARASDTLLNDFLSRMNPQQLQRFKVLYNLRSLPDGKYSMQPLADWEVQVPPASQRQQQGDSTPALEHLGADPKQQLQQQEDS
jgi:hypothetical protein